MTTVSYSILKLSGRVDFLVLGPPSIQTVYVSFPKLGVPVLQSFLGYFRFDLRGAATLWPAHIFKIIKYTVALHLLFNQFRSSLTFFYEDSLHIKVLIQIKSQTVIFKNQSNGIYVYLHDMYTTRVFLHVNSC